ncbi:tRNA (cytidine(34)-2'-O)-methyltransferase [Maribacter arcticus]|jgi:tRNA (cytidine/uridine-2'-O-)-methyltransferase|uniref:Putative tRNA (cytidine(34)-2'-O)-methyltransferase n=1 Tax=Maribacter arcticus TaxID=561365 RepID=A0A1T5DCG8_9FLAO|nr:tRNA (cytidine(34)-2'-O)-methyltransferase [Maribacter arcticus]SKB69321.1 tRNA (cytidine/uridine-2'-O-)-methyltransferase [Maribacter arcticus]
MSFNIVLIEPEIPNNTGNIGRLALATGSTLHLVKPFGFELSDKRLKRAGLDYWQHLNVIIYENLESFFEQHHDKEMIFFSATAKQNHWEIDYKDEMFLVFGKESVGLSKSILAQYHNKTAKIPLYSEHIRSLNLANAVAISIYEGLRQLD